MEYLIIFLVFYFIPTLFAMRGRRASVFVFNLLLGWTILGWALAFYLAVRSQENAKGGV